MSDKFERYCNPGKDFARCWSERHGCSPEFIEYLLREEISGTQDFEQQGREYAKFFKRLRDSGYKQIKKYCSICTSS